MSFKDKVLKVVFVSSSRNAEECLQFTCRQQKNDVEFDHFNR